MKANTRKITITRMVPKLDKSGEVMKTKDGDVILDSKEFPVKINRGVPLDHRMCR